MTTPKQEGGDQCECGRPQGQCIKGDLEFCDGGHEPEMICPASGTYCTGDLSHLCEEYGCARKAGSSPHSEHDQISEWDS